VCGIQHSFPQTNVVDKLRVAIGYPSCHAHQVSPSADHGFSGFQRCCSCCCGAPVSTRRSGSSFGNVLSLLSCHACVLPCIALKFICSFHTHVCACGDVIMHTHQHSHTHAPSYARKPKTHSFTLIHIHSYTQTLCRAWH